ncbi:MAG: hypothetical protein ACI4UC_05065 [Alloprevotella sp.]
MKKIFMFAATLALLVSCGGTGYEAADEIISLSEEYASQFEDAETEKDLDRAMEDYGTKLNDLVKEYKESATELDRGLEDGEDDAFEAQLAARKATEKAMWAYGKKKYELTEAEKEK